MGQQDQLKLISPQLRFDLKFCRMWGYFFDPSCMFLLWSQMRLKSLFHLLAPKGGIRIIYGRINMLCSQVLQSQIFDAKISLSFHWWNPSRMRASRDLSWAWDVATWTRLQSSCTRAGSLVWFGIALCGIIMEGWNCLRDLYTKAGISKAPSHDSHPPYQGQYYHKTGKELKRYFL